MEIDRILYRPKIAHAPISLFLTEVAADQLPSQVESAGKVLAGFGAWNEIVILAPNTDPAFRLLQVNIPTQQAGVRVRWVFVDQPQTGAGVAQGLAALRRPILLWQIGAVCLSEDLVRKGLEFLNESDVVLTQRKPIRRRITHLLGALVGASFGAIVGSILERFHTFSFNPTLFVFAMFGLWIGTLDRLTRWLLAIPGVDPLCPLRFARRPAILEIPLQTTGRLIPVEWLMKATMLELLIDDPDLTVAGEIDTSWLTEASAWANGLGRLLAQPRIWGRPGVATGRPDLAAEPTPIPLPAKLDLKNNRPARPRPNSARSHLSPGAHHLAWIGCGPGRSLGNTP